MALELSGFSIITELPGQETLTVEVDIRRAQPGAYPLHVIWPRKLLAFRSAMAYHTNLIRTDGDSQSVRFNLDASTPEDAERKVHTLLASLVRGAGGQGLDCTVWGYDDPDDRSELYVSVEDVDPQHHLSCLISGEELTERDSVRHAYVQRLQKSPLCLTVYDESINLRISLEPSAAATRLATYHELAGLYPM